MFGLRRERPGRGRALGWGANAFFWMLSLKLFNQIQKMDHKPPVTLGLIAVNYLVFFLPSLAQSGLPRGMTSAARFVVGFTQIDKLIPSSRDGGIIPSAVIQGGQWGRLLWGMVLHKDKKHMYYNMSSLLFKGLQLEPALGSIGFAFLIAELWLLSSVLYCGMLWLMYWVLGAWSSDAVRLYDTAMVGFSGILFGLKVVLMANNDGWQYVKLPIVRIPVPMPPKIAAWAELLFIKYLVPNSSFSAHLCGLLAGLIHTHFTAKLLEPLTRRTGAVTSGGAPQAPTQGHTDTGPNFNTGYPQQPAPGYPKQEPGYSGYPQQPGYPPAAGYPQAGYPHAAGYTHAGYPEPPAGYPQQTPGPQQVRKRRGRWW